MGFSCSADQSRVRARSMDLCGPQGGRLVERRFEQGSGSLSIEPPILRQATFSCSIQPSDGAAAIDASIAFKLSIPTGTPGASGTWRKLPESPRTS